MGIGPYETVKQIQKNEPEPDKQSELLPVKRTMK